MVVPVPSRRPVPTAARLERVRRRSIPTLPNMPSPRRSLTLLLLLLSPLPRRSDALKLKVLSWSDHGHSTLVTAAVGNCAQCGVLCHQRKPDCLAVACSADAGQCQLLGESPETETTTEKIETTTEKIETTTEKIETTTEKIETTTAKIETTTEKIETTTEKIETTTEEAEPTPEPVCDSDWTKFGRACFRVQTEKMQYGAAKTHCRGLRSGSDLASIRSAEENTFLQEMVGARSVWIGLEHAALSEDGPFDFRWLDGTTFDFTHWRDDQPNDLTTAPLCVLATSDRLLWLDYTIKKDMHAYDMLCKYTP